MKILLCLLSILFARLSFSQTSSPPNIFIITTDGFRWQEVFTGADTTLINNTSYVQDTALLNRLFWSNNINERRKLLMPFTWNVITNQGSLYGNRQYSSKVGVANPYHFSYAGYNEIFTGYADRAVIANIKRWNNNENILDFLNKQPAYKDQVAAFTSWNLFSYIFNTHNSNFYLNSGYQTITADSITPVEELTNGIQENVVDNEQHCRNDMLTFVSAKEYIQKKHPKVMYIGFGETDEWAHHKKYDEYLQSAHLFDEYIAQLWYLVNKDPFYKGNTTFIITTDHGRGERTGTWSKHGPFITGSNETWLMVMGPAFTAKGEVKNGEEIFNEQLAQTISRLLGYDFFATQPVTNPVYSLTSR
jgi:hypothetical protein